MTTALSVAGVPITSATDTRGVPAKASAEAYATLTGSLVAATSIAAAATATSATTARLRGAVSLASANYAAMSAVIDLAVISPMSGTIVVTGLPGGTHTAHAPGVYPYDGTPTEGSIEPYVG